MSASLKASGETELVPDFRLMDGYGQFLGEPDQRLHLEAHDEGIVLIIEEWLVVDEGLALHLEDADPAGQLCHVAHEPVTQNDLPCSSLVPLAEA